MKVNGWLHQQTLASCIAASHVMLQSDRREKSYQALITIQHTQSYRSIFIDHDNASEHVQDRTQYHYHPLKKRISLLHMTHSPLTSLQLFPLTISYPIPQHSPSLRPTQITSYFTNTLLTLCLQNTPTRFLSASPRLLFTSGSAEDTKLPRRRAALSLSLFSPRASVVGIPVVVVVFLL